MAWTIDLSDVAAKQLRKLGSVEAKRIRRFLEERVAELANPRQIGKALEGAKLGDLWSYRVGDYRVICNIVDQRLVVLVLKIGNRRDVYK